MAVDLRPILAATLLLTAAPARAAAPAAPPDYQAIDLIDLTVDIARMQNRTVEVTGYFHIIGGFGFLGARPLSTNGLPISFDQVPRDERRRLLADCDSGCTATVRGRVRFYATYGWGIGAARIIMPIP